MRKRRSDKGERRKRRRKSDAEEDRKKRRRKSDAEEDRKKRRRRKREGILIVSRLIKIQESPMHKMKKFKDSSFYCKDKMRNLEDNKF